MLRRLPSAVVAVRASAPPEAAARCKRDHPESTSFIRWRLITIRRTRAVQIVAMPVPVHVRLARRRWCLRIPHRNRNRGSRTRSVTSSGAAALTWPKILAVRHRRCAAARARSCAAGRTTALFASLVERGFSRRSCRRRPRGMMLAFTMWFLQRATNARMARERGCASTRACSACQWIAAMTFTVISGKRHSARQQGRGADRYRRAGSSVALNVRAPRPRDSACGRTGVDRAG